MARPVQALIDVAALRSNLSLVRQIAPHSNVISVVKANAYGHGAVEIARAIDPLTDMLTVSCIEEAAILRDAGIESPILLLEGVFSASELHLASRLNLQLVVHEGEQIAQLEALDSEHQFTLWLKLDTGMHRLGIQPSQTRASFQRLKQLSCVKDVRLMSHFSSADSLDNEQTGKQISCFSQLHFALQQQGYRDIQLSLANSAGLMGWPESQLHWVRPGIMLYGLSPFSDAHKHTEKLKPVMTLKSSVIGLRDIAKGECVGYGATWCAQRKSRIATVAIGYGDGYPRNAKSGTPVLINGHTAYLAGRVSMDLISVDVTDLPEVKLGDEVILWGKQLGANEVASWADTIGYELVTRMPARVPRIYINELPD